MKKALLFIPALLITAGCTTPVQYTNKAFTKYDKNTEYAVDTRTNGFDLTVKYSRYQFIPESDAVAIACKAVLTSIAHELADNQDKKISIDDQRIKLSMGRNGFSGITSCAANTSVKWK